MANVRKLWPDSFWKRVVVVILVIFLILNLGILFSGVGSASAAPSRLTKVSQVHAGWPAYTYRNTLADRRTPPAVRAAMMKLARGGAVTRVRPAARFLPGCKGTIIRTVDIHVLIFTSIKIAWKRVIQNGWCWNNTRITSYGPGAYQEWTAPGYCFYNNSHGNIWWSGAWERKIWNTGTLRTCARISLQKTITAKEYYQAGGGANTG